MTNVAVHGLHIFSLFKNLYKTHTQVESMFVFKARVA